MRLLPDLDAADSLANLPHLPCHVDVVAGVADPAASYHLDAASQPPQQRSVFWLDWSSGITTTVPWPRVHASDASDILDVPSITIP